MISENIIWLLGAAVATEIDLTIDYTAARLMHESTNTPKKKKRGDGLTTNPQKGDRASLSYILFVWKRRKW